MLVSFSTFNTDVSFHLTNPAPSADERIVLDFRGPVVLEPSSNCDNDYLEIRDGQYGFSPLVGRFCTDSWRLRPVISTGPWLWLRLQTDYTIEKTGFQAVYYFEPNRLESEWGLLDDWL
ncbi:Neuropilin (Nrp) and tolloid (Tll) [Fasciola gigantica]|uniref:Neuropilin (Nrp) and tolloid (Tll) n=1 Tax=Fasciola gigantica TaxID=46835 RepID=A0A504ZDD5_FASGI|nr:Neuropilin (Nrp) and tolloid (Tll) [Fasciola gigantica]